MPPTVILIRHAEGTHNASSNWMIPDPDLTARGIEQCRKLSSHLQKVPIAQKVELIVVSPLRRTLQTAEYSLDFLLKKDVPVELSPDWQENSMMPCDTGTPAEIIGPKFPSFDFSSLDPEWPKKKGKWAFTEEAVLWRGRENRKWLKSRPEAVIAVVSHSAFLRTAVVPDRFANADYRVYDFSDETDDLVQWPSTEENGGGMGTSSKEKSVPSPSDWEIPDWVEDSLREKLEAQNS